jgi:leucyl aminopeptidase
MLSTVASPALSVTTAPPSTLAVGLIVLPVFDGDSMSGLLKDADEATAGAIGRALASRELQGRLWEFFITPVVTGWNAERIGIVGGGKRADCGTERLRRLATAAALQARQRRISTVAWLNTTDLEIAVGTQSAAEGLMLAAFSGDAYKSSDRSGPPPEQFVLAVHPSDGAAATAAAERGRILGECCNQSRELCNEPANLLTPSIFAERAVAIAGPAGISVEVLDDRAIADLGMGLLLGVARGSAEPPRLIVLRHDPPGAPETPVLGLVGKGITFDTGGISIKPAEGMERMKDDMSGGAAVICAMRAVALLGATMKVVGIVPTTENMPGGRAVKPGDVLTSASGKTVEVINTDAEGRLVLGDALWYAQRLGATHLVDVATLTGACVVALGKAASGLFGQPQPWVDHVHRTALAAGDRCWPMPLYEEYEEQLRSEIADLVNSGGRPAGACTAATFLKAFTGGLPWAHLDIAGTAWADDAKPWQPKGATGVAVRTLAELALTSVDWFEGTSAVARDPNW